METDLSAVTRRPFPLRDPVAEMTRMLAELVEFAASDLQCSQQHAAAFLANARAKFAARSVQRPTCTDHRCIYFG